MIQKVADATKHPLMRISWLLAVFCIAFSLTTFATTKEPTTMNPLFSYQDLPNFNEIKPSHFEPAIDELIKSYKITLDSVTKEPNPLWSNTLYRLDEEGEKLDFATHVISHLNSVNNIEEMRRAYETILPKLSDFSSDISQNKELYELYIKLKNSQEFSSYSDAQKTIINNGIRDFKNSGIDLSIEKKTRLKAINARLSELRNVFSKNIIDSTQSWNYHVTKDRHALLEGLPQHTVDLALAKAQKDNKEVWVLTLDAPCYQAIMSYAHNRNLRETFYRAYSTIASKEALDKQFDNSAIIDEMLTLRQEYAHIIGYDNYAEYSLAPKMAGSTTEVMDFLNDLAHRSKPQGEKELTLLKKFAKEQSNITDFASWDSNYYATLYQKTHYNFSDEELRPYFPEDKVFSGLFKLASRLYNIKFTEIQNFSKWHETVRLFEIKDQNGNLRGRFYTDLFARDFKNSGAWMAGLMSRMKHEDGSVQTPVAFLEANFTPASADKPSLLSHREVVTLFHEFGHTLHHTLSKVDYPSVSGTHVPWDAVELPSQFMENWSYQWEVIENISGHYKTHEPLPKTEFDKLIAVKNYNSAMAMLRQLEFALFDFRIYMHSGADAKRTVQQVLDDVRQEVSVIIPPNYNRFQNSFSHIFAGGYSAGYYSYKWAEILSSDAFSKFEEAGIWNETTGQLFLKSILQQGGSRPPLDLFIEFRGRKPKIDALLKHSGITG